MMETFNSKTVSRIVGVSLRQIQYWDEQGFIRPSVRTAGGRGTKRLYSFSDLIRLKVVKNLSECGLSLHKIRRCLEDLRRYSPDKVPPLEGLKYVTDGERLFVLTADKNKILNVMNRQFVLSLGIGNLVRELNGELQRLSGQPLRSGARTGRRPEKKKTGSPLS